MREVRIHGRGGQGAVIASKLLAAALFRDGLSVQAFPAFGVERRGAPVTAFLRCAKKPIQLRCEITDPDDLGRAQRDRGKCHVMRQTMGAGHPRVERQVPGNGVPEGSTGQRNHELHPLLVQSGGPLVARPRTVGITRRKGHHALEDHGDTGLGEQLTDAPGLAATGYDHLELVPLSPLHRRANLP